MQRLKILLIDDHALFREGVALLLRSLADGVEVIEAGSCAEAFGVIESHPGIQLVIIDLGLPGMSGMDGISVVRERYPEIPVVVMSSDEDMDTVLQALDKGAMGFIPKSSPSTVMIAALKLILAGGIYLPPSVFLSDRQGTQSDRATRGATHQPISGSSPATPAKLGLTERQAEVLYLILQGKPAKVICRELNLSSSTVKTHTSAVLRALNVTTRTQAVVAAGKLGLRFEPRYSVR